MDEDNLSVRYRDPKFRAEAEIHVPGQPTIRYDTSEVPMSLQDEYARILGDGKARVAVTVDMGVKDFGTGVSSSCTVALSCNQDLSTIQYAADLAGSFARYYVKESHKKAEEEFKQLLAEKQRLAGPG